MGQEGCLEPHSSLALPGAKDWQEELTPPVRSMSAGQGAGDEVRDRAQGEGMDLGQDLLEVWKSHACCAAKLRWKASEEPAPLTRAEQKAVSTQWGQLAR